MSTRSPVGGSLPPCCFMMERVLLPGLLLLCCAFVVQSLECHYCTGVADPRHCTDIETCKDSEVCFTERILSHSRVVFHNSGCIAKQMCTNAENIAFPCDGLLECVSFCDSDRCNKDPCVDSGYEASKRSCKELKRAGLPSGVYTLDLRDRLLPFQVYCDMDTAGGGWTVFQRRKDGSVDFYRGWYDYTKGFGNLSGEFWLGNNHLHRLTKAGLTTLRVDLGDWEGNTRYAQYSSFQVGPASDYYRLNVSGYSGTANDSFSNLNGMAFTTKGADHDTYSRNCAEVFIGAWWYSNCHGSNLNGKYYVGGKAPYAKGVVWVTWKGFYYSLKSAEMKLQEP